MTSNSAYITPQGSLDPTSFLPTSRAVTAVFPIRPKNSVLLGKTLFVLLTVFDFSTITTLDKNGYVNQDEMMEDGY